MIIECKNCGTKFRFPDEKVGPGGVKVRCGKCSFAFKVMPGTQPPDKDSTKVATAEEISEALRRRDTGSVARANLGVETGVTRTPTIRTFQAPTAPTPAPEKKEFQVPSESDEQHHVVPAPKAPPPMQETSGLHPPLPASEPPKPQPQIPLQHGPAAKPLIDRIDAEGIFDGIFKSDGGTDVQRKPVPQQAAPAINLFNTDISADLESLDELQVKPAPTAAAPQPDRWADIGRELVKDGPVKAPSATLSPAETSSPRQTLALGMLPVAPLTQKPPSAAPLANISNRGVNTENPFSAPFAVGIGGEAGIQEDSNKKSGIQAGAEKPLNLEMPLNLADPVRAPEAKTTAVHPVSPRTTLALFGQQADDFVAAGKQPQTGTTFTPQAPAGQTAASPAGVDIPLMEKGNDYRAQMESMGASAEDAFSQGNAQPLMSTGRNTGQEIIDADDMQIEPIVESSPSGRAMSDMLTDPADFSELLASRKTPEPPEPQKTRANAERRPAPAPVQTPAVKLPVKKRKNLLSIALPWTFTAILLVAAVAMLILPPGKGTSTAAVAKNYRIQGFKVYETKIGRKVAVVTGEVLTGGKAGQGGVRVRFTLSDYAGQTAFTGEFAPSRMLSPVEIHELETPEQLSDLLKGKGAQEGTGDWSPFQAIFFDPPGDLERFVPQIQVTGAR